MLSEHCNSFEEKWKTQRQQQPNDLSALRRSGDAAAAAAPSTVLNSLRSRGDSAAPAAHPAFVSFEERRRVSGACSSSSSALWRDTFPFQVTTMLANDSQHDWSCWGQLCPCCATWADLSCTLCQIGASNYGWQDKMLMHVGIGLWLLGPPNSCFCFPDSFPVVHLVEGGQPVCMLGVAVMGDATWLVVAYGADLSYWLP